MIRGILKAVLLGWVAKKFAGRNARRNAPVQPVGGTSYPDRRP